MLEDLVEVVSDTRKMSMGFLCKRTIEIITKTGSKTMDKMDRGSNGN
jgi:hypothetical protein